MKKKQIMMTLLASALSMSMLAGCTESQISEVLTGSTETTVELATENGGGSENTSVSVTSEEDIVAALSSDVDVEEVLEKVADHDYDDTASGDNVIVLSGDTALITGSGAEFSGNVIEITQPGVYQFSGEFMGQIHVLTEEDGNVQLVLGGVSITNDEGPAIYVENADNTIITLLAGTTNSLKDSSAYMEEAEEGSAAAELERTNGAIYAKDDLIINGEGAMAITASNKSGILGKDDIEIYGGTISIDAAKNGIKGKDLLYIKDVSLTTTSGSDGLESESLVMIEGGEMTITAVSDGVHSDDTVVIYGGSLEIATDDDGIHSDLLVQIDGGDILITRSYEGIEALDIILNGGTIDITASDDGVNITEGSSDVSTTTGGFGGPGGMMDAATLGHGLYIYDGTLVMNASGDGLDSNGSIYMYGGIVIVSGPVGDMDGSIDYNGEFIMEGGYLIAAGSSGMLQAPSTTSTVNSLVVGFGSQLAGGTLLQVLNSDDEEMMNYEPDKVFSSLVFATPDLIIGETYQVVVDGELYAQVTLTDTVTTYGSVGNMGGFGGHGGGGQRPGNMDENRDGTFTRPERQEGSDGQFTRPEDGTMPEAMTPGEMPEGMTPPSMDGNAPEGMTPPNMDGNASQGLTQ